MSTALERRAEAAAAAVRAAVAGLEPAPGALPEPPRRRWPALVAAVVLLVAAIGGAVLVQRDEGDPVITGPDGALPRLVLDDVPEGLIPSGAGQLPVPDAPPGGTTFRLYGRGDDADPLRHGDVAVMTSGSTSMAPEDGRAVPVRGVTGRLTADEGSGVRSLSWQEEGVGRVSVMSRSLPDDELVEVAEDLRRADDDLVVSAPAGYRLVTELDHLPGIWLLIGLGETAPDEGAFVGYDDSAGRRFIRIASLRDEPGYLEAIGWLGGSLARAVTIQGHDGWLVDARTGGEPALQAVLVAWRDGSGAIVNVTAAGFPEEQVLSAAEGVRQATDQEWADLVQRGREADGASIAEEGTWRYTLDPGGGLCFEVTLPEGIASVTCSAPGVVDDPQLYEGAEPVDEGVWLHGRVPDEVARVAVQPEGGQRQVVDTVAAEGGGRAWAALVPPGPEPVTIVALNADGTEVERMDVVPGSGWVGDEATTTTTG